MSDKCGHPCHERRTRPVHQRRPRRDLGRKLSLRRPSCRPCEAGARQPMGIGARGPPFLRGCCVISIARLVAGLLVRFIARAPSSPAIAGTALFRCASSTSSLISSSSPSPALICSLEANPLAVGEGGSAQHHRQRHHHRDDHDEAYRPVVGHEPHFPFTAPQASHCRG